MIRRATPGSAETKWEQPPKLPIFVSAGRRERTVVSVMNFCFAAFLVGAAASLAVGASAAVWLAMLAGAAFLRGLRPRSGRSRTRFH